MTARALIFLGILLLAVSSGEARTNVDLNINIGTPPVVVREVPSSTTIIVDDDPDFVFSPRFGFYIGFGIPLDIIYFDGFFWLYRDNGWHRGHSHRGPWYRVKHRHVPWEIRRYDIVTIREYRDREYVVFQRERDRYPHRHFRADREWHEKRRHERDEWKRERRHDRDEWKRERRLDRDEWKEEKRREREEWKDRRRDGRDERHEYREERGRGGDRSSRSDDDHRGRGRGRD